MDEVVERSSRQSECRSQAYRHALTRGVFFSAVDYACASDAVPLGVFMVGLGGGGAAAAVVLVILIIHKAFDQAIAMHPTLRLGWGLHGRALRLDPVKGERERERERERARERERTRESALPYPSPVVVLGRKGGKQQGQTAGSASPFLDVPKPKGEK